MTDRVHVIGGGLAGSEAAWQLGRAGVPVALHEMRPIRQTEAHKTGAFAELVCSNSFRSDEWETNAVGLLHEEMRRAGSLIIWAADTHKLPAGGALAVDRDGLASNVTEKLEAHPLIEIVRGEIDGLPPAEWDSVIVATGPLTSPALAAAIQALTGEVELAFFDAIAPIVYRDTIDMDVCWLQSRYGPMKPVGLSNPHQPGSKPYAVVQLRQDNALGTLWNMVGFQTKLKHGEQTRIFRTIPGLEKAEFARLGGIHRNTFLNSLRLLDATLRLHAAPRLRFAGQITGCEGYVESAAIGLLAGRFAAAEMRGEILPAPPPTTAIGALLSHITGGHIGSIDAGPRSYQPMNINFGLFPPLATAPKNDNGRRLRGIEKALAKKRALACRALE